jgi:hypothetical protein
MKVGRILAGGCLGLALWLSASPAAAWIETHVVSDDVRVEIARSGLATIDHAITMHVKGGPLRSFDLALADAELSPLEGTVISAQTDGVLGLPVPLTVTQRPDGALRVNVESTKGLSRGAFLFHVRYSKSLLSHDGVRRDGAMLRVAWVGPVWQEGLDNAKCTFVLPAAPTEPRPPGVGAKGDPNEDGDDSEAGIFISEVKRSADRDEIELVRPHVARGEAVRWSVRVDPRALRDVSDPRLRPPPVPPTPELVPAEKRFAYGGAAGTLLFGFSLLAFCKVRQVKRYAKERNTSPDHASIGTIEPRALIPIRASLRVLFSGPALAFGVAMQLRLDDPWWGTWLVFLAMALVCHLPPAVRRSPRGPGRWLPLGDTEAFAKAPPVKGAWLDAGTRTGFVVFSLSLLGLAGLAFAAARVSTYNAYLVVFDGAVLFALFGTGSVRDLPRHPVFGPGPTLGRMARSLRRLRAVRVIAWARLPEGSNQFDELRLLAVPKVPLRGFTSIEVGLVGVTGAGGFIYLPEVLVRVVDTSPCHEALLRLLPGLQWLRGRRGDERVASLKPRLPTIAMTAALVSRLIEHTRDTSPPRTDRQPTSPAEMMRPTRQPHRTPAPPRPPIIAPPA